jgi:hypothetical protein
MQADPRKTVGPRRPYVPKEDSGDTMPGALWLFILWLLYGGLILWLRQSP